MKVRTWSGSIVDIEWWNVRVWLLWLRGHVATRYHKLTGRNFPGDEP